MEAMISEAYMMGYRALLGHTGLLLNVELT
jgi:hypothetical protein